MLSRVILSVLVLPVLFAAVPSQAIVIRHDRDDTRYTELGERYPAAVTVLPDGTGTLIHPRWVLTAAHVARGVARRSPRVQVAGEEYRVQRAFVHPGWRDMGPHDVGLLELARPVEGVEPAALYRGDDESGKVITFVGRGDTGTGLTGPGAQDRKKRGATNTIDQVDDDWIRFTFQQGDVATDLEGVSGPGDSGGPAFLEVDGKLYTLGVSALADGDNGPGRYGVREYYTRVSTHLDWIESTVAGKSTDGEIALGKPSGGKRPGERAMAMEIDGSMPTRLPDSPAGQLIDSYLSAYNANSQQAMAAFIKNGFDDEFRASKTPEEHLELYRRLYDKHFGELTVERLLEDKQTGMTVMFASARGPMAKFSFELTSAPKIAGMQVAIVDFD